MSIGARPAPGYTLLSPDDHTLVLVDYQAGMALATRSAPVEGICGNAALRGSSRCR